jgi:hypothetical protein
MPSCFLGSRAYDRGRSRHGLKPFSSERMSAWPSGKAVDNVKNDLSNLIEWTVEQAIFI